MELARHTRLSAGRCHPVHCTVQTALVLLLAGSTLIVAGISLKRIRKREQAGKGFALIALVVGIIALLLTGVAIAVYGLV